MGWFRDKVDEIDELFFFKKQNIFIRGSRFNYQLDTSNSIPYLFSLIKNNQDEDKKNIFFQLNNYVFQVRSDEKGLNSIEILIPSKNKKIYNKFFLRIGSGNYKTKTKTKNILMHRMCRIYGTSSSFMEGSRKTGNPGQYQFLGWEFIDISVKNHCYLKMGTEFDLFSGTSSFVFKFSPK